MKINIGLFQLLSAGLVLSSSSAFSSFSLFENAVPADDKTTIVRVVDQFNPTETGIPVLLTNDTGYEIRCNSLNGLGAIFEGLGLNANLTQFIESVPHDDPRIVESNYQENPVLNCERSEEHKLFVVEYPEGSPEAAEYIDGLRYFIHFGSTKALNMIGCQGLLSALGYSVDEAEPMPYEMAHSFFVDVGDEHDIHCISGEVVGPRNCGEHEDGSLWLEPIDNGEQAYICNGGVAEKSGGPVCDSQYIANGDQCVYVPKACGNYQHGEIWRDAIPNGNQDYSCQDGVAVPVGAPSCNSGYEVSGSQCIYVPKHCGSYFHGATWQQGITGGTQTWQCNDGVNVFQSVSCNTHYRQSGELCQYVPKACGANAHGSSWTIGITGGTQTWRCDDGVSHYVSVNCSANYTPSGRTCQYVPKNCGNRAHGSQWTANITGGSQTWKCHDGATQFVAVSCSGYYVANGQTCRYAPKSCGSHIHGSQWTQSITGGKQTWKCDNGSSQFVSVSCNTNYTRDGKTCRTFRSCGNRAHNSTWTVKDTGAGYEWCRRPLYFDNFRCNDGHSELVYREVVDPGVPKDGSSCRR